MPVAPFGAVKVCATVLSPLVGVVAPSRAQYVPPWQPELITVSEAPVAVQPESVPVSNPPLMMPPLGGGGVEPVVQRRICICVNRRASPARAGRRQAL